MLATVGHRGKWGIHNKTVKGLVHNVEDSELTPKNGCHCKFMLSIFTIIKIEKSQLKHSKYYSSPAFVPPLACDCEPQTQQRAKSPVLCSKPAQQTLSKQGFREGPGKTKHKLLALTCISLALPLRNIPGQMLPEESRKKKKHCIVLSGKESRDYFRYATSR